MASKYRSVPKILSPALRQKLLKAKLRRILKLLERGKKRGQLLEACREYGCTPNTYQRYKKIYAKGGEEALRQSLSAPRKRAGGRPRKHLTEAKLEELRRGLELALARSKRGLFYSEVKHA